jgi:hypothetical protein
MDRRAIVGTALRFGALSGVFAVVVQLISFYIVRGDNRLTITAGLTLEVLIIGEAGRLLGRQTGRLAAGIWTGGIAGGLSELIRQTLARVVYPYSPAGQAAWHVMNAAERAQVTDPTYIAQNVLVSVGLVILLGLLYGGLGAWAEVRAKP